MGSNIRIGKDPNTGFWYLSAADAATLGISAYIQTLLNDADATAAQATLGLTSFVAGVVDAPRAVGAKCENNTTTPNTQFDLNADWLVLVAPGSFLPVVRKAPGVITNDVSTSGPTANGRDQGAVFSANSWVHFYWIWNGTTLATLSSASPPPTGPSLPSGYTHWAYAFPARLNGSSAFYRLRVRGAEVFYEDDQTSSALTATSETNLDLSASVPPNALSFQGHIDAILTTDGSGVASAMLTWRVVTGVQFYNYIIGTLSGLSASTSMRYTAPQSVRFPNVGQALRYIWTITSGSSQSGSISIESYKIPNGGE